MTADITGTPMKADGPLTTSEIRKICQHQSEIPNPPQAFLISADSMQNSLLAVRTDFLDDGEGLPWPGMPLLGATFSLDWGYAFVDVSKNTNVSAKFEQPACRFEDAAVGDTWGYRLCPVDDRELPKILDELAYIRNELSQRAASASRQSKTQIIVADL